MQPTKMRARRHQSCGARRLRLSLRRGRRSESAHHLARRFLGAASPPPPGHASWPLQPHAGHARMALSPRQLPAPCWLPSTMPVALCSPAANSMSTALSGAGSDVHFRSWPLTCPGGILLPAPSAIKDYATNTTAATTTTSTTASITTKSSPTSTATKHDDHQVWQVVMTIMTGTATTQHSLDRGKRGEPR